MLNGGKFEDFSKVYGKRFNMFKSSIMFSRTTTEDWRNRVASFLRICETNDLGRYIGFPTNMTSSRVASFDFIMGEVNRLALEILSPAGCLREVGP